MTIARWIAAGVQTLLCFDPTRGIDIRTKRDIYLLLRELAAAGAAVLLYTSELEEIQLACDRAIVIFGGRVVDEIAGPRPTRRRCCARRTASAGRDDRRGGASDRSDRPCRRPRTAAPRSPASAVRRGRQAPGCAGGHTCTIGAPRVLAGLLVFTQVIKPTFGAFDLETLSKGALPLAFAAVAQAIIVISGGIDLSIGSMMALTNVTAALLMKNARRRPRLDRRRAAGPRDGLRARPGERAPRRLDEGPRHHRHARDVVRLGRRGAARAAPAGRRGGAVVRRAGRPAVRLMVDFLPKAAVVLLVVVAIVWLPLRRSRLGLSIYAIGSDRLAAFRAAWTWPGPRSLAYAIGGLFAACGGLALTMSTGIGTPTPGLYTLQAVTAIVLGG